jgi:hypothetical protein
VPSFRTARVTRVLSERPGLQRVETDGGRAYALTQLTGTVAVGDRVVINTTAVDRGLGTGGWHVVHWNLERDSWSQPGPGHIMKVRYTSLQVDAGAAEEEHPDVPADLEQMPVVVGSLHSQVGVLAATIHHLASSTRVAYVMTDGGALPLALSDLVAELVGRGLLVSSITAGQSFGGDLEAVSVPSALTLARHVARADITIVAVGPGVVGTTSALGTSAVDVAAALDAAAALGGQPIACVRASDADERARHRGVSHHTTTALGLVRSPVRVPVPPALADDPVATEVVPPPDVAALLEGLGLQITTMGRGPAEDPLFFATAGAAAALAVARAGAPLA